MSRRPCCRVALLVLAVGICSNLSLPAQVQPAADAPQPLSPEESRKCFRLPPGFRIELVASEPWLADPTDMAFDAQGRLFVCELHGYNLEGHYDVLELNETGQLDTTVRRILAPKETLERAERESHGTVKLLEDTDGDGRMDRLVVWATNLPPCYGVVPAREGVIVLCAPDIIYLGDRDGDGQPDTRETLFTGFGVGEMWTRISNPHWGVDNWIYAASGVGSAATIRGPRLPQPVQLGNTDFRFKADGSALEPVSGGTGGFGLALDDFNHRFLVSNQQHALSVAPLPYRYLARNPYFAAPPTVNNICAYGHPARVYPLAPPDPWRLARSQQPEWVQFYGAAETQMGLVTAACAPLIYRARQFPAEYQGAHFSCECAYNLVHLCRLQPDGADYRAVRAIEAGEFLTSTEQWFRPVNLGDGPDGGLYIVDMYREIIEDYSAIPRYLQQQYGLIAGRDRGRIWRVVYAGNSDAGEAEAADRRPAPSPAVWVSRLASGNAWWRLTAQRLLVERGDPTVVPSLLGLARAGASPEARLHALYTLAGLHALSPAILRAALEDAHAGVRRHALQLADARLADEPGLLQHVMGMTADPDPQVRLQVALSLGETGDPRRLTALALLARKHGTDRWMPAAIVSSVTEDADRLLQNLLSGSSITEGVRQVLRPLVGVIGARRNPAEIMRLLELTADYGGSDAVAIQAECLGALAESLKRGEPPDLGEGGGPAALTRMIAGPAAEVRRLGLQVAGLLKLTKSPRWRSLFEEAFQDALNPEYPVEGRLAMVDLLASAPFDLLEQRASELLAASQPLDVQLATVRMLAAVDDPGVGPLLLAGWAGYSPQVQTAVLDALFQRQDRIRVLLTAIRDQAIPQPGLDALRRQQLRENPDETIRRLAGPVLERVPRGGDRQQVLQRYQAALAGPRDPVKGRHLFQLNCATCHRLEGVGKDTGPELIAATKGRADQTILLDILQPSDQITVGFRTYTIVTADGFVFSGTLLAETATSFILPDEDGIPQTVLRKDIASMQASDLSLMPANFEELLEPQDVADVMGYLREVARAGPGARITLFEDEPEFARALGEGEGTATVVTEDFQSGAASLKVTPPQRFSAALPGWEHSITEHPGPGQYRYLRFAWKAPAAQGVMLELAAAGQWPPADQPVRRYCAGQNTTGWAARQVAEAAPAEWRVLTVDLWKDCGEFTLTGIAPTAMGGPAYFDSIELLRDPE